MLMERVNWRPERHPSVRNSAELTLKQLLAAVWQRRLAIAACIVACIGLAVLYVSFATPLYTASATVLIDSRKNAIARETEGGSAPLDVAEVESQVALVTSHRVANAVVERLQLDVDRPQKESPSVVRDLYRNVRARISALKAWLFGSSEVQMTARERAIKNLLGGLSVHRSGAAYVIDISYTSDDPNSASITANAVAEAYIDEQLQSKAESWKRAGVWLRDRLNDLKDQSRTTALQAQSFKSDNGLSTTNKGLLNEQQLESLNESLLAAQTKTNEARSRVEQIRDLLATGNPEASVSDALRNEVITRLRQLYFEKFTAEAEWSARYGKDHTAAVRLRQEMGNIQKAIRDELARIQQSYSNDLAVAQANEARVKDEYLKALSQSSTTNIARVEARELDRVAAGYENAYEQVLKQYNESINQQSFPLTEARVITPASTPLAPSQPKKTLTVGLAGVFGLGLGIALAVLFRAVDTSIRTPDQIEDLGIRCITVIPGLQYEVAEQRGSWLLHHLSPPPSDATAAKYVSRQPRSRFAERFRSLKTELTVTEFRTPVTCIGITSGAPNEGKSTTASNLALVLAASGARTLLIDGDLRNPKLSRLFAPKSPVGLSDILANFERLPEALHQDPSGLMFLSAGELIIDDPGDLLGSEPMRKLLAGARNQFDRIIVDLPPVGPVSGTRTIAPFLDGIIIVAGWASTTIQDLRSTVAAFEHEEDKILGCVLNKADYRALTAFGEYKFGHYYGQSLKKPQNSTLST